jgi:hypothetical protein
MIICSDYLDHDYQYQKSEIVLIYIVIMDLNHDLNQDQSVICKRLDNALSEIGNCDYLELIIWIMIT